MPDRVALYKKHIKQCGKDDNGQNGLEPAQNHPDRDPADSIAGKGENQSQRQAPAGSGHKQHDNISQGEQDFNPRIHAVDHRLPGEVLPDGNVLQHGAPPPLLSRKERISAAACSAV